MDAQGRVFGKINIFDLIVLVLCCLILIWGLKRVVISESGILDKQSQELANNVKPLFVEMLLCEIDKDIRRLKRLERKHLRNCGDVSPFLSEIIVPGDVKIDEEFKKRKLVGDVNYQIFDFLSLETPTGGEQVLLWVQVPSNTKEKGREKSSLKVNSPLYIPLKNVDLFGVVTRVGTEASKINRLRHVQKVVGIHIQGKRAWFAGMINSKEMLYGSGGEIAGELIDAEIEPALMQHVSDSGEVYEIASPIYKDIQVTAKIRMKKLDHRLFWGGQAITVGGEITLRAKDMEITGTITDLRDV